MKPNELKNRGKQTKIQLKNVIFVVPENVRFKCSRCGNCCKEHKAPINFRDLKRISKHLKKTKFRHIKWIENTTRESKNFSISGMCVGHNDGACVFLEYNKCNIYRYRPLICRMYPFRIVKVQDNATVFVTYTLEEWCNGYFEGFLTENHLKWYVPIIQEELRYSMAAYFGKEMLKKERHTKILRRQLKKPKPTKSAKEVTDKYDRKKWISRR